MDFALNEDQLEFQQMVREFVEKEITPIAGQLDEENATRPELFKIAEQMGLLNVIVPEEYGGPGLDSVTVAAIYEELGKGCAGVATSMAANSLATAPVLLAGNDAQKKMWCDVLNNGGLAAFALTEPGAGSDAGSVSTRAVHDKEKKTYTLNGTKTFITNGGIADIYLIFANTRKDGGIRGLTAFIVPRDTPGFKVGKKENKMGIRPSNTCELILEDVVIPEENRVGREGQGFRIAMNTLDSARPFVGAVAVGLAQAALDEADGHEGRCSAPARLPCLLDARPGHDLHEGSRHGQVLRCRYGDGSHHRCHPDHGWLRLFQGISGGKTYA